ncbi:zinc finger CCCH domain-containing protein 67-like [Phoenix dactylifera]|uniref:Zinc finger CCCH domain-containing protein 67-like n=1 Tax=Phoenix dactylifera TaxID=42345 RepID=A0A8B8ZI78_PHODC|nr:zinc finger CCCH domain-containing protein 67-like [Phoenix dactylifera]
MAMYGGSNKNCLFIHHHHHAVPIPVYIRLSCGATDDSPANAAAITSSDRTGSGGGMLNLKDRPDDFLMYIYKVKRCSKTKSHDWTECPYAHRGEKARRRDPNKYPYSGIACPEFRLRGECQRGQSCEYAHGVFEFWLHPTRYRTRVCEAGAACTRRICFFAHTPEQLRPEVIRDCFRCGIGRCVAKPRRREAPAVAAAAASSSSSFQSGMNGANGNGLPGGGGEWLDFPDLDWVEDLLTEKGEGWGGFGCQVMKDLWKR